MNELCVEKEHSKIILNYPCWHHCWLLSLCVRVWRGSREKKSWWSFVLVGAFVGARVQLLPDTIFSILVRHAMLNHELFWGDTFSLSISLTSLHFKEHPRLYNGKSDFSCHRRQPLALFRAGGVHSHAKLPEIEYKFTSHSVRVPQPPPSSALY